MSKASPSDLIYGHLGKPVYDSESHQWQFSRHPHITRRLSPLGKPIPVLSATRKAFHDRPRNLAQRRQGIKELASQYPEIQPATSLLPDLAQVSEVVNEVTSGHDPTVSDLLAYGQALSSGSHRNTRPVPIVAVAGGSAGESLRLVRLTKERLRWELGETIFLESLTSNDGCETSWTGNCGSIQQLVFADPEGRSSSPLAVRYHGAVALLAPRLETVGEAGRLRLKTMSKSQIDPNPIANLSVERSRGVSFANVSFNPRKHNQFATLDQGGYWIVWNAQGVASQRGIWTIEKGCAGYLLDTLNDKEQPDLLEDGWGVIMWAGKSNKIVAASRMNFTIFDISQDVKRLNVPRFLAGKSKDWILDIKSKPSDDTLILVLTSSALYWIKITASKDPNEGSAQCLLSWSHFRNNEDTSLRLHIPPLLEDADDSSDTTAIILLLYSRLNGSTMVYTLHSAESSTGPYRFASDPFLLPMDGTDESSLDKQIGAKRDYVSITNIAIRALPFGFDHRNIEIGRGQLYSESAVKFYQLNVLYYDLSLSECLYAEVITGSDLDIRLPEINSRKRLPKTPKNVVDPFVVSDDFEAEEPLYDDFRRPLEQASLITSDFSRREAWTISFNWLENLLYETSGQSITTTPTITGNLDDALQRISHLIERQDREEIPTLKTLLDLAGARLSISDVDEATSDFKKFLDSTASLTLRNEAGATFADEERLVISKVLTPSIWESLNLRDNDQISGLHESFIEAWISPLSTIVPSRARISMEKQLRPLAGQLLLAGYAIHSEFLEQEGDTALKEAPEIGAQLSLPVRRRASVSDVQKGKQPAIRSPSPSVSSLLPEDIDFSQPSPPRTLPTPEPTPSLHSQSSGTSVVAENPSSRRLRAFADLVPQHVLPVQVSKLFLDPWHTGTDPADFDWEAAEQAFASEDEEELEAYAKQRERAEKHRKRRREPTFGSLSQPLPKRHSASQPEQIREEAQSSSQATERKFTASQVEPGPYGGRPGKMKKQKSSASRKPGF